MLNFFCIVCGRERQIESNIDSFSGLKPVYKKCDCGFDFNKPEYWLTKSVFIATFCPICGRHRNEGLSLDPILGLRFVFGSRIGDERIFDRCPCGFDFKRFKDSSR